MKINLIAIGKKMPAWVKAGFDEYARRLPVGCALQLVEIEAAKRGKRFDVSRALRQEGAAMIEAIPKGTLVVALDVKGKAWCTEQLSGQLENWQGGGRDVSLLIGGPEGLAPECLAKAELRWSLSALTLPHPLVRIVVAEQLYRAWTVLNNHPYHRA
ncbi:23S rRNA (pseudouridine(1915)-N(3))-methyltransferase RlmH [Piscirickettsia litoralis]|uniref:Ribosomal RNA large subunit methyltransferase H n=1 Tax=Piscirickettsia litoralis TaxID=1891921 RepID=A0ABX3A5P3_9GAMM|nr:23S rRNA (pseudouridine(1915)-N(3))-methyltransferase RlmH [Piscirickettsia litoralis]ODN42770.1 23S rRNA (pseudouridine(1915)-N(3))-methyltransferase RlmH [Piscirickettsia litoralis]